MEATMKPLNLNDEWEDIVNANRDSRQQAAVTKKRVKTLGRAKRYALSALCFSAASMVLFCAAPAWYSLTAALACIATFQIGRFVESFGN